MTDEPAATDRTARHSGTGNGAALPPEARQDRRPYETSAFAENDEWASHRGTAAVNSALLAAAAGVVRRPPLGDVLGLARKLAEEPDVLRRSLGDLAEELGRILAGRSELEPWRTDRRYADGAWRRNLFLRSLAQQHASGGHTLERFLDELGLDRGTDYRLRIALTNIVEALSPANFFLLNPGAVKAALDTGGGSIVTGVRRFIGDMRSPPRLPVRTDPSSFELGVDIAATPGWVIHRTPLMELIQYDPATPRVHDRPLLMVPSIVNKHYLTDLSPGTSLAEYAVAGGQQTFGISWINADSRHRELGLDAYVSAIVEALEIVRTVSGTDAVHLSGMCAGGELAAIAAGYLAAVGAGDRVAGLTLLVCVLDYADEPGPAAIITQDAAAEAIAAVAERGFVDGRDLAGALAWLRPVDSFWWPFTHRYLLAADTPHLDLFYWSEDVINVPAALLRDLIDLALHNRLVHPGSLVVLGEPIDLRKVRADAYVVAGVTDHITDWKACYRSQLLLGSKRRFVLVRGGHIQSIVRPPGKGTTAYSGAPGRLRDPDRWLKTARPCAESWWPDWLAWLAARSNGEHPAPKTSGGAGFEPLDPAPGVYVRRRLDER